MHSNLAARTRAPTRGAPTGPVHAFQPGREDEGTHKGCPYGACACIPTWPRGRGHPQGVPLRGLCMHSNLAARTRAPTRGAPTGFGGGDGKGEEAGGRATMGAGFVGGRGDWEVVRCQERTRRGGWRRAGCRRSLRWRSGRPGLDWEAERERIREEISSYPAPIAGCDEQFDYLLERRAQVRRELARLVAEERLRRGAQRVESV